MRGANMRIALAIAMALGLAATGNAAETYQLNIPAQPLSKALQSFAQQSGLSLVHYSNLTAERLAPAIEGSFTSEQALRKLLENSGLEFGYINDNTVEIREAGRRNARGEKISASGEGHRGLSVMLAQTPAASVAASAS